MFNPDSSYVGLADDTAGTRSFWKKLLIVAALATIACQLLALSMLAEDQVDRSDKRASTMALERSAVAKCLQSGDLSRQSACLDRARQGFGGDVLAVHETIVPDARFSQVGPDLVPVR